jgi:hypothetical protein
MNGDVHDGRAGARPSQRAAEAVASLGLRRDVDPNTALLEEVHWAAGHVACRIARVAGGAAPLGAAPPVRRVAYPSRPANCPSA